MNRYFKCEIDKNYLFFIILYYINLKAYENKNNCDLINIIFNCYDYTLVDGKIVRKSANIDFPFTRL